MTTYNGGAKRGPKVPRFRDIDGGFLLRVAEAFSDGSRVYEQGKPPEFKNWKQGDREFAFDVLDHAISHLIAYKECLLARCTLDTTMSDLVADEDHLGHLGANLVMLDYFERRGFFAAPQQAVDTVVDQAGSDDEKVWAEQAVIVGPPDIENEVVPEGEWGRRILKALHLA